MEHFWHIEEFASQTCWSMGNIRLHPTRRCWMKYPISVQLLLHPFLPTMNNWTLPTTIFLELWGRCSAKVGWKWLLTAKVAEFGLIERKEACEQMQKAVVNWSHNSHNNGKLLIDAKHRDDNLLGILRALLGKGWMKIAFDGESCGIWIDRGEGGVQADVKRCSELKSRHCLK